ncbi:MarR family winged helix-turn-helix transcriptional regulator [Peptoniphilus stercorisuis]|uniref:DNA-binding MarR family transcriptional regulator n=1 Tax=Peptoniphilus stercorisuis TaxID=1436965 RepID=A0ABS4KFZ8_9FIRM|nr:helix-turn-helix domain-containing protein [Peptoniphilus stercorisuis]MBP2025564.1 DNA-binding MarR family transcriptional regulator [Peptoniphilus stercorisuis]
MGSYKNENNIFYIYFQVIKKYKDYMEKKLCDFNLAPAEIDVVTFLINNIESDITAKDIVEVRGISKGLVSKAVSSLRRRKIIYIVDNPLDKRSVFLRINTKELDLIDAVKVENRIFLKKLLRDMTMEELQFFSNINNRMLENMKDIDL